MSNKIISSSVMESRGGDRDGDHNVRERGELRSEIMGSSTGGGGKGSGSTASNRRDRDHYDNRKGPSKSPPHSRGGADGGSS